MREKKYIYIIKRLKKIDDRAFSDVNKGTKISRKLTIMPSQEDMDLCTDKVLSKDRILQELTKAVKLVSRLLDVDATY